MPRGDLKTWMVRMKPEKKGWFKSISESVAQGGDAKKKEGMKLNAGC